MKQHILQALLFIFLFLAMLHPYADPDWGWHFKNGEYFLTHGQMLKTDTFSWTMQGFYWINQEWGYDPILYLLSKNFGFAGLSVIGSLVGVIVFLLLTYSRKLQLWGQFAVALFFIEMTNGVLWLGLRSQVLAFLPLAILIFILYHFPKHKKYIFALPPVFFLWANLHGSVVLGIGLLTIYTCVQYLIFFFKRKRSTTEGGSIITLKELHVLSISLFASFIATLLNPYTYNIYLEAFRHISDPLVRRVTEWQPIDYATCPECTYLYIYVIFILVGILFLKRVKNLPFIVISAVMLYLLLTARRYFALFTIVSFPLFLDLFIPTTTRLSKSKILPIIFIIFLLIGVEKYTTERIYVNHLLNYSYQNYCNVYENCSEKLIEYLTKNPPRGRGFNFYDWGGFFIGRGVMPVFIDGRMTVWNNKGYIPIEEHTQIYFNLNLNKFNSYNFNWVAIPHNSKLSLALEQPSYAAVWKLTYTDSYADYFVRQ